MNNTKDRAANQTASGIIDAVSGRYPALAPFLEARFGANESQTHVYFYRQKAFTITLGKGSSHIEVAEPKLFGRPDLVTSTHQVVRGDDGIRLMIDLTFDLDAFLDQLAPTVAHTRRYVSVERFGCCHDFIKCSDQRACLYPDDYFHLGCYYRENLEAGRIFYGANQNIVVERTESPVVPDSQPAYDSEKPPTPVKKKPELVERVAVLDVETANGKDKGSICSIGVIFMEGTEVIDSYYSLVRPLSYFHPVNVGIHGISDEDVVESPTFADIWPELWPRLKGHTLLCYNASFDISAIERALHNAGLEIPNIKYACALKLSKRFIPLASHKLTSVAEYFGIIYDAHNALEDVTATAQVIQRLADQQQVDGLNALMSMACQPYEYTLTNNYDPVLDKPRSSAPHVEATPLPHGNSPYFLGKTVVFSGDLTCATRAIAQRAVEEMGGHCATSVSKRTDVLVVGFYDPSTLLPGCTYGKKFMRARELQEQGHAIEIIDENDFMAVLLEDLD